MSMGQGALCMVGAGSWGAGPQRMQIRCELPATRYSACLQFFTGLLSLFWYTLILGTYGAHAAGGQVA